MGQAIVAREDRETVIAVVRAGIVPGVHLPERHTHLLEDVFFLDARADQIRADFCSERHDSRQHVRPGVPASLPPRRGVTGGFQRRGVAIKCRTLCDALTWHGSGQCQDGWAAMLGGGLGWW